MFFPTCHLLPTTYRPAYDLPSSASCSILSLNVSRFKPSVPFAVCSRVGQTRHSSRSELNLFINERNWFLLFDDKSSLPEFVGQACHISGLQQLRTQHPMNLAGCSDDGFRDLVQPLPLGH